MSADAGPGPRRSRVAERGRARRTAPVAVRWESDPRVAKARPRVESFGGRPHGRSRRLGELGNPVSRGTMADVYDAYDRLLGRIVAIKVLASAFDRDGGRRRAVPPRARAAAHLS